MQGNRHVREGNMAGKRMHLFWIEVELRYFVWLVPSKTFLRSSAPNMLACLLMERWKEGGVFYVQVEFEDWNLLSSCRVDPYILPPLPFSILTGVTPCSGGLYLANSGNVFHSYVLPLFNDVISTVQPIYEVWLRIEWLRFHYQKTFRLYGSFLIPISITVKVKVNFTLEQATKTQRGSRGIALLFL